MGFAEAVGVSDSTVEGWVYHGARPSDKNLSKIGRALAPEGDSRECDRIVRDLRLLYRSGYHIGYEDGSGDRTRWAARRA